LVFHSSIITMMHGPINISIKLHPLCSGVVNNFLSSKYCIIINWRHYVIICHIKIIHIMFNPQTSH